MESLILLKTFFAIFTVYGITQIVTEAKVFAWLRDGLAFSKFGFFNWLGDLLSCFLCTSVWVSFVFSFFVYSISSEFIGANYQLANVFLDGMYLSALVWFFYIIESKLSK